MTIAALLLLTLCVALPPVMWLASWAICELGDLDDPDDLDRIIWWQTRVVPAWRSIGPLILPIAFAGPWLLLARAGWTEHTGICALLASVPSWRLGVVTVAPKPQDDWLDDWLGRRLGGWVWSVVPLVALVLLLWEVAPWRAP